MIYYEAGTGERLDKWVSENVEGISRSLAVNFIESGICTVNGIAVAKNYRLKSGDKVSLVVPEAKPVDILPENIPLDIRFEDDDLLIVNKPHGMVVHPACGNLSKTLVNALMYHCGGSLSGINGEIRPGIVHRIDKNTSGLLLVAKNDFTHTRLAGQLKAYSVKREYQAVVSGIVRKSGTVDAPVGRHKVRRKEMCVNGLNPRNAVTHYEVIEYYKNATHLRIRLQTGRTHQIRVHMAYIGHPVLGDDVYGNGKPKLGGQCLHAGKLGFVHPRTEKYMEFESELPQYFNKLLLQLKVNHES
ncbi:MAG: RluA family pseudouridine synthase [Oscillospiraceae bacterium]|jgi:23S rRNA pseudouridine1911/1915/1917 synthase|nr:RluA family pseudouridine synthase [Oscillospiraceae bacterium]